MHISFPKQFEVRLTRSRSLEEKYETGESSVKGSSLGLLVELNAFGPADCDCSLSWRALINCFCEGLSIMTFVAYMIAVGKSPYC